MEQNTKSHFTISEFKKFINNMIATNDNVYSRDTLSNLVSKTRTRSYTKEEILEILKNGSLYELQELSKTFFKLDGFYRRICIYYATILKYTGILIPHTSGKKELSDESVQKRYYKALDFIEKLNIPILCENFAERVIRDGCYYGIIQSVNQDKISIIDLPSTYCRTNFKDSLGNDLLEFNLSYFDSIKEEERDLILASFPKEIQRAYRRSSKTSKKWYMVPAGMGVCFPLFDCRPPLIHIIPSILDYEEAINNAQERDKEEIRKILIQKIPHITSTGELVFEPEEAEEMHAGAVQMMKHNPNISVLTTYADVSVESSKTNDDDNDIVLNASKNIYEEAGVSSELFAATGNLTLDKSIKNDLAFVMPMANKFSVFITNLVNQLYKNSQVYFKYKFLPISYYNETDYINDSHKLASSGYSYLLPALAMDLNQKDLIDIKDLENNILELRDKLIPLSTSYTESAGAPEKAEGEKSDKTLKNESATDNGGGGNNG